MKRLLPALFLLAAAAPAFAASAVDFRRTLSTPVGQKTLRLETPQDMCFLDRTDDAQKALYTGYAEHLKKNGGQFVLAVFAKCMDLARLGGEEGTSGPISLGAFIWMNPAIGEATLMPREDYLDMREAAFPAYVANIADGLKADKNPRRTAEGILLGAEGTITYNYQAVKNTAVFATTSINDIPLEVSLSFTGADALPLDKLYALGEKLLSQQISLNEKHF